MLFSSLNIVDNYLIKPAIVSHTAAYQGLVFSMIDSFIFFLNHFPFHEGVQLGQTKELMFSILSRQEENKKLQEWNEGNGRCECLVWEGAPDLVLPRIPRIYEDVVSLPVFGGREEKKKKGYDQKGAKF